MKIGQIVSVDIDDEEYGRVCGNAKILEINDFGYLVACESIRANIYADKNEIFED